MVHQGPTATVPLFSSLDLFTKRPKDLSPEMEGVADVTQQTA